MPVRFLNHSTMRREPCALFIFIACILVAAFPFGCLAQRDLEPPNFNGRWREDLRASRRLDGRALTDAYTLHVMTLEYRETQLHISLDIQVPDPKNNRVITYDLQTDGRVYEIDLGEAKALAYAKWEGSSLTTYLKRRLADGVVLEVLRTMTLGKDRHKMTALMRSWRDGRPSNSVNEVWDRKELR